MANISAELAPPLPAPKTRSLVQQIVKNRHAYFYVGPALFIMALVLLYPLIYTIVLSLFNTPTRSPDYIFIGLENYVELFNHQLFWLVMRNTVSWTIGSTITSFILGMAAALLVNNRVPFMGVFKALLIIPYVIGHVTAAYLWRWLMHPDLGFISMFAQQIGLIDGPIPFLQDGNMVMWSLVLVNTWKTFPFVMIMILAGLQAIPQDLYKAARVDGANVFQQFVEITIPQLMPVILVTTVLTVIGNFNSFTIPWIMTGGGPANQSEIIITWIYSTGIRNLRYGFSSAISVVLFMVLSVFSYYYVRTLTRGSDRSAEFEG
ncbi:MAG: sugar ABC transporter permease [Chloroflexi bacterium]|nr:sugar ABC transporter permease [Chloroflexota bacterium]